MTATPGRSCIACGAPTGGATRCPRHATGGGTRPRRCLVCGTPTSGADHCADHADPRTRQAWRADYNTGEYGRNRAAALTRDQHACTCCGATGVRLEVDHVIPLSAGGDNRLDNLRSLCLPCHRNRTLRRPCHHRPA